jgi:hypothetical protein
VNVPSMIRAVEPLFLPCVFLASMLASGENVTHVLTSSRRNWK